MNGVVKSTAETPSSPPGSPLFNEPSDKVSLLAEVNGTTKLGASSDRKTPDYETKAKKRASVLVGSGRLPNEKINEKMRFRPYCQQLGLKKNVKLVKDLRTTFQSGKTKDVSFRIQQLKALHRMFKENEMKIVETVQKDLRKPAMEIRGSEIDLCVNDIENTLHKLRDWVKETPVPRCMVTLFNTPARRPEPYGVVLVLGAWNYPVSLTLSPVCGAIAAGNCVVIKPSDQVPNTAKLFAELISKYLDSSCYKVVCGGVPECTELLKQRFDYMFYTGGYRVGKIVREASNRYLTPCTLELGGKSPVYLDDSVGNMDIAVKRIIWGKLVNAGQSCIAPDYMLCSREVQDIFVTKARTFIKEFLGSKPQESAYFGRIINAQHFQRLAGLLHSGVVAIGGDVDPTDLYIAPTVLVDVKPNAPVMREEIFGPILPIINVDSAKEAVDFINSREKPLTVYCFSSNRRTTELLKNGTSSGTFVCNDVLVHFLVDNLPFGGVGASGMGQYHGKASFDTFSHTKSVLNKDYLRLEEKIGSVRYPPFTERKLSTARFLMKKRRFPSCTYLPLLLSFLLGVATVYIFTRMMENNEIADK